MFMFIDIEGEETVSVMLNGEESEITFFTMNDFKVSCNSFLVLLMKFIFWL